MTILVPLDRELPRAVAGGKGANLATLTQHGFPVPTARVVPVAVFDAHLEASGVGENWGDAAKRLRAQPLPSALSHELQGFIEEVGGRVSVRSSATLEDAPGRSFAGQFMTLLNVGIEDVDDALRDVWASTFSDHVTAYLTRADLDPGALRMAVVVQRQLDPSASGVAFGDTSRVTIEAVFGHGEAIVSGEVEPDHWVVESKEITSSRVSRKVSRRALPAGPPTQTLERVLLSDGQQREPSLGESEVIRVAEYCASISDAFDGRPQDCEFAFADGELLILQSRDTTSALPVEAPPLGAWEPPGKGTWELDAVHVTQPCTRLFQKQFSAGMIPGMKSSLAYYGALLSHIDIAFVNGFFYSRVRPLGAPVDAASKEPPPKFVFKLLLMLMPALRRRVKTASKVFAERTWREQLRQWEPAKARSITKNQALQNVDMSSLSDAELADHFRTVYAHVRDMVEQHHRFNFAPMIPIGDLLNHAEDWSGGAVSMIDVLTLLAGSSPLSADLRSPDAQRFGKAARQDPQARAFLRLDDDLPFISNVDAIQALEAIRRLEGDAGERAREFLALRDFRLSEGIDPGAPCLHECPALLWRGLRAAALFSSEEELDDAAPEALARCLALIPEAHHETFNQLVEEARRVHSLRDEKAMYSDVWAWGILRTVVLHIGERLVKRSRSLLNSAADLIHADDEEILELLMNASGPSADTLRKRAAFRNTYAVTAAPSILGLPPGPPPSGDLLPPGAARVTRTIMTALKFMAGPPDDDGDEVAGLRGQAASAGVYEGFAHVVRSSDDVRSMQPGAVLVVGSGSSSFTMLAPLAAAVIAEGGGMLSHVAIVCREYGIPCVCGCAGVLSRIQSGDRVVVDGNRGVIEVVDA